jgi:hypothetical protein
MDAITTQNILSILIGNKNVTGSSGIVYVKMKEGKHDYTYGSRLFAYEK